MKDDIVFFAGAGASWSAPTNLPLFSEIQGAIAAGLAVEPALLSRLAPEATMMSLHNLGLPVEQDLTSALQPGIPNLVHYVLAEALARGLVVWTPNIDIQIERAAGWKESSWAQQLAVWTEEEAVPEDLASARLLKPHGSLHSGDLKLRSDQVLVPLDAPWTERLMTDFNQREVVIYGYAGRDPDLRPALQKAFRNAGPVTWFEPDPDIRSGIRETYETYCAGGLSILPLEARVDLLHAQFVRWANDHGLLRRVPPAALRAFEDRERQPPQLRFDYGDRPLPRAELLSLLGETRRARRAYGRAILDAARRLRVDELAAAGRARLRFAYWHDERKIRALGWILGSRYIRRRSGKLRDLAYDRHLVLLLNRGNLVEAALLAGEAASERGHPSDHLNHVAVKRWLEPLPGVERQGRQLLREARRQMARSGNRYEDVQTAARSAFEVALTAYWQGHIDASREALLELRDLSPHVSARWIAWSDWLQACHAISLWDFNPVAGHLDTAEEVFASEGPAQRPALAAIRLAQLALERLGSALGRRASVAASPGTEKDWSQALGRPSRLPVTVRGALTFERAERCRLRGEDHPARRLFGRLTFSAVPLHRGLGMLGLAELGRECGHRDSQWAERAMGIGRRFSIGWLQAQATLSMWLAGSLSDESALEEVGHSGAELPSRAGFPGPERWLISGEKERRPLLAVL